MRNFVLLNILTGVCWAAQNRGVGSANLETIKQRLRVRASAISPATDLERTVHSKVADGSLTPSSLSEAILSELGKYSKTTPLESFTRISTAFRLGMDYLEQYLKPRDAQKVAGLEKLHNWMYLFNILNENLEKISSFKKRKETVLFTLLSAGQAIVRSPTRKVALGIEAHTINDLKPNGVIPGSPEDVLIRRVLREILSRVAHSLYPHHLSYCIETNSYFVLESKHN